MKVATPVKTTGTRERRTATESEIQGLCRRLADLYRPVRITLFGSHARGDARPDSDVDLLVEMEHSGSSLDIAGEMLCAVETLFPVDILVRTPGKMRERALMGDPFAGEIIRTGKVVYENTDR